MEPDGEAADLGLPGPKCDGDTPSYIHDDRSCRDHHHDQSPLTGDNVITTTESGTTTNTVTSESAAPTITYPEHLITNGDFGSLNTKPGSILPWTYTTAVTGGVAAGFDGANVCVDSTTNCRSLPLIRATPPVTAGGTTSFVHSGIVTRPATIYTASFLLRCLNGDSQSGFELYFVEGMFGRVGCEARTGATSFRSRA
ncbi:hypothetical protein N0V88_002784 [Collariella sp. IMI 366227]|nr:hypothetical protein N0V88_002784 [Collariella sp. IMI 366227]